jgi:hypothetical protein
MAGSQPLPPLLPLDQAQPCDFARLPDDCVGYILELAQPEGVPCLRGVCRALRVAASPRSEGVSPGLIFRSGPTVAAWAWEQPAFRDAAGCGLSRACAELGYCDLLERVLAHRNDTRAFDSNLWARAGEAGHVLLLQRLLGRAARLTRGDATQLNLIWCGTMLFTPISMTGHDRRYPALTGHWPSFTSH